MSAIRVFRDGIYQWEPIDDGASPSRSAKGIRGAPFDNPVLGSHASGESRYSGKVEKRTGAHSPKYRTGVSGNGVDRVRLNPDNGAVEASTTEVQR